MKKPLTEKQLRQRQYARYRWKLMGMIGTTHFAEKGLRDLVSTKFEQDFYQLQNALKSLRVKLQNELARQKAAQQAEMKKESK